MFYIVLLAMVAVFLALRLYAVLGKRTGHEQVLTKPAEERTAPATLPRTVEQPADPRDGNRRSVEAQAQTGLRTLVAAEPGFDVGEFLEGAKSAYRMILEAFWKGDEQTLDWLTEHDVRQAFGEAIAQRASAGHVLDNRLVSIERAVIVDAAVENRIARVTVAFDADIAAVTRDADGAVVSGSMTDAEQTHDVWTFTRGLKSDTPNWKLADTD